MYLTPTNKNASNQAAKAELHTTVEICFPTVEIKKKKACKTVRTAKDAAKHYDIALKNVRCPTPVCQRIEFYCSSSAASVLFLIFFFSHSPIKFPEVRI